MMIRPQNAEMTNVGSCSPLPYPWRSMRATGTTSEPRRGHAQRVRPCPRSRSGAAACNAAECKVREALQVLEVAARCGRVVVLPLVLVLAGLMELGSVVVCSLFSRLSDSVEARDQHAGAASSRPGVRHPSPLARNPCSLHLTYPIDFAYLSAGLVEARETVFASKWSAVLRGTAGR